MFYVYVHCTVSFCGFESNRVGKYVISMSNIVMVFGVCSDSICNTCDLAYSVVQCIYVAMFASPDVSWMEIFRVSVSERWCNCIMYSLYIYN